MNTLLTLQDIERARHFYERGYWGSDTLYTLLRASAERTPDRFALRDANSRMTFRTALQWVDAVAADLHHAGLRAGDRVSIWLPSRVETALVFLACSRMGYVCNTSLHRDYNCQEIVALLERAGSAAFFAQAGYGADGGSRDIFSMLGALPRLKKTYRIEPLRSGIAEVDRPFGLASLSLAEGAGIAGPHNCDRIVYLAFTSGTTGKPKGVMHSDNTILANARAIAKDWGFDEETIVYSLSPMSHNIGIVGLAVATVCGGELVAHTPLDASRMLDRIIETGATYLLGVPTHAIDLLSELRRRGMRTLGRVDTFQLGGAANHRAGAHRNRRENAECVRHDREPLLPIYPSRRSAGDHRLELRAAGRRHGDQALARRRLRQGGRVGRDRGARRARSLLDAGLFRRPGGHRACIQSRRLVHDRRPRALGRARQPPDRRPQEGSDHPRRPQHLSGAHRGLRHAARGGRKGGCLSGPRRAPGRARLSRRDPAPGHRALGNGPFATPQRGGVVEIRHARVLSR